jgi:ATP-dependent DNA ligase
LRAHISAEIHPPRNPHHDQGRPDRRRLHEPKLHGYRLQVVKQGPPSAPLQPQCDWIERLPILVEALKAIPCRSAVIDAELCHPGAGGAPDLRKIHGGIGCSVITS